MKLEAGKKYIRRDGKVVGPLEYRSYAKHWPFYFDGHTWTINGMNVDSYTNVSSDLVAEYTEPTTNTEYERGIKDAAKWMLDNLSAHEARMMLNELL